MAHSYGIIMDKEIAIKIADGKDYQVGDFLNALDEVVCTFAHYTGHDDIFFADALEMYARHMRTERKLSADF